MVMKKPKLKLRVGDEVEMKFGIPNKRIVAVFPMNRIPAPDRVDVVDANAPDTNSGVGIPGAWIKKKVRKQRVTK